MKYLIPSLALQLIAYASIAVSVASCSQKTVNNLPSTFDASQAFFEQRYQDIATSLKSRDNLYPKEQYYLALSYIHLKEQTHYADAISLLEQAANAGITDAAWELAQFYENGTATDINLLKALDWYRIHNSMSHPPSNTVVEYYDEQGKAISSAKMTEKLESHARDGDVDAQMQLAKHHYEGSHLINDLSQALYWYEAAANQGNQHAALMLGYFYCRGIGSQKSSSKANHWLNIFNNNLNCN